MDDAGAVRSRERRRDRGTDAQRVGPRQTPAFAQPLRQALAVYALHHDYGNLAVVGHVEYRHDVRFVQARGGARFARDPGRGLGAQPGIAAGDLERDLAVQHDVVRGKNVGRRTRAQVFFDPEASGDHRLGLHPRPLSHPGRGL